MSHENLQRQVAKKIKQVRQERGLRQKDLAKHGYPVRHYQKIESGQLNLTLKTLVKISEALDSDVTEFFCAEDARSEIYRSVFYDNPLGIIVWKLEDRADRRSITLFDYNRLASGAVYRDLDRLRGKKMIEVFPRAEEQAILDILFDVITTGKPCEIPELIRYDREFPLTVFSTKVIRCAPGMGAAIFRDVTAEFMSRQESERQRAMLKRESLLPVGENLQVRELQLEVNELLRQLGRSPRY